MAKSKEVPERVPVVYSGKRVEAGHRWPVYVRYGSDSATMLSFGCERTVPLLDLLDQVSHGNVTIDNSDTVAQMKSRVYQAECYVNPGDLAPGYKLQITDLTLVAAVEHQPVCAPPSAYPYWTVESVRLGSQERPAVWVTSRVAMPKLYEQAAPVDGVLVWSEYGAAGAAHRILTCDQTFDELVRVVEAEISDKRHCVVSEAAAEVKKLSKDMHAISNDDFAKLFRAARSGG